MRQSAGSRNARYGVMICDTVRALAGMLMVARHTQVHREQWTPRHTTVSVRPGQATQLRNQSDSDYKDDKIKSDLYSVFLWFLPATFFWLVTLKPVSQSVSSMKRNENLSNSIKIRMLKFKVEQNVQLCLHFLQFPFEKWISLSDKCKEMEETVTVFIFLSVLRLMRMFFQFITQNIISVHWFR